MSPSALREAARVVVSSNETAENIGARRLPVAVDNLLEQISFNAQDRRGATIVIDTDHVNLQLIGIYGHRNDSKCTTKLPQNEYIPVNSP